MRSIPLRLGQEPVDATIYATTATIFYCTIVRGSGVSYILGFLEVARVAQLAVHLTSMSSPQDTSDQKVLGSSPSSGASFFCLSSKPVFGWIRTFGYGRPNYVYVDIIHRSLDKYCCKLMSKGFHHN